MSFLDQVKKWFGVEPPRPAGPEARLDETFGDATIRNALDEVGGGNYLAAQRLLEETTDPDTRAFFVHCLARHPNRPAWLDLWLQREGERSAIPWLVSGRHRIEWAWEARSRLRAQDVPLENLVRFAERLEGADADLVRASEMDPNDPLPHAERITVAVGLTLGRDAAQARFAAATARSPHHYGAHRARLMSLVPKWGGGTTRDSLAFVRAASRAAPDGSRLHALVAWAHAERWLYFTFDPKPDVTARAAYLRSPDVSAELRGAYERGLAHPSHPGGWAAVADANIFAFVFWLGSDPVRAMRELDRTQGMLSLQPWQWANDPPAAYYDARAWCLGG